MSGEGEGEGEEERGGAGAGGARRAQLLLHQISTAQALQLRRRVHPLAVSARRRQLARPLGPALQHVGVAQLVAADAVSVVRCSLVGPRTVPGVEAGEDVEATRRGGGGRGGVALEPRGDVTRNGAVIPPL